jgi:monoamine oxidase
MVAWCGGEPAAALAGAPRDAIASAALESLADRLGVPARKMKARLLGAWTHDWDSDPHARGAYSYARVGGAEAAQTLSRPVQSTLFFAGEATDTDGNTGTVEGALASGQRAAKQVRRALGMK